jgi:hypothetical protein
VAQDAKMLARDHKNTLRSFCKRQRRCLVGSHQVLWLWGSIVGGPGCGAGAVRFSPERTSSVKRPIHAPRGKSFGKSRRPRARAGRVRPGVSYDKDAPASSLPNVPRKDRAVALECTKCRARYIAVLDDDPPDWKPHCIECDTPFGPVRGRAVYSLFAEID